MEADKLRLAQVLMEHGASLSATFKGTYPRLTPLFYAVKEGKKEMAELILKFKPLASRALIPREAHPCSGP